MLKTGDTKDTKKLALKFILLMGIVSALGDVTYEGQKAFTVPSFLGAGATTIGFVSGLGEFVGYVQDFYPDIFLIRLNTTGLLLQ